MENFACCNTEGVPWGGDGAGVTFIKGVKSLLSTSEARLARLVCKDWAAEFAASTQKIQLPAELWQIASHQQEHQLERLVKTYCSFNHVNLLSDSSQEVSAEALQLTVHAVGRIAILRSIAICQLGSSNSSISGSSSWETVLQGLASLPENVTRLELKHVRLPGPAGLGHLSGLHNIRSLVIQSSSSSKLQQEHVAAIAGMSQLTSLKLSFRAVNGCLAQPLTLDCLGQLSKMQQLDIKYTGMMELASGVCFSSNNFLPGCSCLTKLDLKRVPTLSLQGLFRKLQLRHLTLLQLSPLVENQARSLGLCTQLDTLIVDNMPLELVPHLATLTSLTSFQLSVWDPPANGGADLPGGPILSLTSLRALRTLSLAGPMMLCREDILTLSAAWQSLSSLNLAVTLLDGSQGFAGFSNLEVLRLRPWQRGVNRSVGGAGLGGEEDGPSMNGLWRIFASTDELPASLLELEGRQLVFVPGGLASAAAPAEQRGMQEEANLTLASRLLNHTSGGTAVSKMRSLKLQYSPDGVLGNAAPELPAWQVMQGLKHLELQHPLLTSQQLAAAVAACGSSLTSLIINTADVLSVFQKPVAAEACVTAATAAIVPVLGGAAAAGLSHNQSSSRRNSNSGGKLVHSSSSHLRRASNSGSFMSSSNARSALTLLSGAAVAAAAAAAATGPVAAAAGMPQVGGMAVATVAATAGIATAGAAAGALSRSNSMSMWSMGSSSLATLLNEALSGLSGAGSSSASGFSSMGQQLREGLGLAVLAHCAALQELSLVVGDRVLGASFWGALGSLPELSKLTLAIASDVPAVVAREVAQGIASLKGLTWVGIGMEGPGSSDAVIAVLNSVAAALPACQLHVLRGARV